LPLALHACKAVADLLWLPWCAGVHIKQKCFFAFHLYCTYRQEKLSNNTSSATCIHPTMGTVAISLRLTLAQAHLEETWYSIKLNGEVGA
jgi:hypothetical protein